MNDLAIRRILEKSHTIAMVGLSANWYRPSFFAAKYLLDKGYQVIPVNPNYEEVLGQKCYADIEAIPIQVDVVDLFQRSEEIEKFIQPAFAKGAKVLWMQLGIENELAATTARDLGMEVVMNRCMKIEYARLFGGLGWMGVDTGIITAKRANRVP